MTHSPAGVLPPTSVHKGAALSASAVCRSWVLACSACIPGNLELRSVSAIFSVKQYYIAACEPRHQTNLHVQACVQAIPAPLSGQHALTWQLPSPATSRSWSAYMSSLIRSLHSTGNMSWQGLPDRHNAVQTCCLDVEAASPFHTASSSLSRAPEQEHLGNKKSEHA